MNEIVVAGLLGWPLADRFSISEDRHMVRDLKNFFQSMRDEKYRAPSGMHFALVLLAFTSILCTARGWGGSLCGAE